MNWADFIVLGIIVLFGVVGLKKGLIYSVFRLLSFFISLTLSVQLSPALTGFLMKTPLKDNVNNWILENLMHQATSPELNSQVKHAGANAIVDSLNIPGFMKGIVSSDLAKAMPDPSSIIDTKAIMSTISLSLTRFVIGVISVFLLYIIIRIALIFLRKVLQGIASLPLIKQINSLGGFAFGAVEGLLTIYIILAVVLIFNAVPQFKEIHEALNTSLVAGWFYKNNIIVSWIFPK